MKVAFQYKATLVVTDPGWVDLDFYVPSSCLAALPVLPISQLPQQNWADIGTSKFMSTQPRSATSSVTLYISIEPDQTKSHNKTIKFETSLSWAIDMRS